MKKAKKWLIGIGIALAVIIAAGLLLKRWIFPPYDPPAPTGGYTVEEQTYTWEDEGRVETYTDTGENRSLTVKFWYPEEEGEYPLIIFSHGAFGVIDSNYSTCTELASHGYVVASIGHPYHAMYVEDVNGKTTYVDRDFLKQVYADTSDDSEDAEKKLYEFSKEWMEVRTGDMNFVLDTVLEKADLQEEGPFKRVDTQKIGLFGHSMGGATAVELGRKRGDISAVIDLEGTMLGEYTGFEGGHEVYNEMPYTVPVMDVISAGAHEQIEQEEQTQSDWEYVNHYVGRNAADYREVIFNDAGHLNFTDLPMFSPVIAKLLGVGEVNAEECIGNVNHIVLIFFDYYLKDEGSLEEIQAEY